MTTKYTTEQADVLVTGGGTLYSFVVLSPKARAWFEEHVDHGAFNPEFPNTVFVDHRFAADLAEGIRQSGLVIR